jgi:hypothetical protein
MVIEVKVHVLADPFLELRNFLLRLAGFDPPRGKKRRAHLLPDIRLLLKAKILEAHAKHHEGHTACVTV